MKKYKKYIYEKTCLTCKITKREIKKSKHFDHDYTCSFCNSKNTIHKISMTYKELVECDECFGTGEVEDIFNQEDEYNKVKCLKCSGLGKIEK